MKQMFVLFAIIFGIQSSLAADSPPALEPYYVVRVISATHDVNEAVTSTGTSWRDLAFHAGIPNDGPAPKNLGNQGGKWTISFEDGLGRILNFYSKHGYELHSYNHPTAIFRRLSE